MGALVQPPPTARTDRRHPTSRVRTGVLSAQSGHRLTQANKSPENTGRFKPSIILSMPLWRINMKTTFVRRFLTIVTAIIMSYGLAQDIFNLAATGTAEQVREAIAAGANIEARDDNGVTPLMLASAGGSADVVQALLAAGANTEARDAEGWTPLMWASMLGSADVVQALLAAGANTEARNDNGRTPLMYASWFGSADVVQALLAAGANAQAQDQAGNTAWTYAQENKKLIGTETYWRLNDARF